MKFRLLFWIVVPLLCLSCYKGKCYQCRKYAPDGSGSGATVYIGNEQVCPEKDNIHLVDPAPGDSTDLWECEI